MKTHGSRSSDVSMDNFNKHLACIGERCVLLRGVHCHIDALVFSNAAGNDAARHAVAFASYLLVLLAPRRLGLREQAVHQEGGKVAPTHAEVEHEVDREERQIGSKGRHRSGWGRTIFCLMNFPYPSGLRNEIGMSRSRGGAGEGG